MEQDRAQIEPCDLEALNRAAKELSSEIEDVLQDQAEANDSE